MKAAVLRKVKSPFKVESVELDGVKGREVRVRVAASGLCHSDYHFVSGDLPFVLPGVLGHEAAGVVEAVGPEVTAVKLGDHVVSSASSFCGHCNQCVSGRTHTCEDKPKRCAGAAPRLTLAGAPLTQGSLLGAFAEEMLVHENALVRIPREMPLDRAALLGCGVLTGLGVVFNAAKVHPGSKVVVLGCGGVGLNVVQGARIAGAEQVIAVDLAPQKLELAAKLGATHTLTGGPEAEMEVRELSKGGVDYAFEVIGLPTTIEQAVRMLGRGGLMTIVGATRLDARVSLPSIQMLMNEWRVQGSYMGSSPFVRDIPRFANFYMEGRLDLDSLVAERIRLEDINRGFETMLTGTQARSVITFPDVLTHAVAAL